jgi:acyl-CoA dehydrogenase
VTVGVPQRPAYGEDHETFRASVRRLLETEVVPHLDDWRGAGAVPESLARSLGEQGFLGTSIPEDLGGGGTDDPRFVAVLVEETVAIGATGLALVLANHCGVCIPAMLRLPDSELRTQALAGAASGSALAAPMRLDGGRQSRGVPGAMTAGQFVVSRVDPGDERTVALHPRDVVEVQAGPPGLGGLESAIGDVRFTPASFAGVPTMLDDEDLLGRDFALWSAVVAAAGARRALELALAYVRERKVFGRPLSDFENTRFRLAEVSAELGVVEPFVSICLDQVADGTLSQANAAAVRMVAGGAYDRAVDQSLQLHGGYGYMREYPIAHAYGDARFVRQAAATMGDPRPVLASAIGL